MKEIRTETNAQENLTSKGAYIASKEEKHLDGIILATGSEVSLAIEVKKNLKSMILTCV